MGDFFELTEVELAYYRTLITKYYKLYKKFKRTGDLVLFIIWIYEFAEMYAVNGAHKKANLKYIKQEYNLKGEFIMRLYSFRNSLVHKPYSVTLEQLVEFMDKSKSDLNNLLSKLDIDLEVG